jgi:hypothetical protein
MAETKRKRPVCTCQAYQWPHRPGSGFCRYPDPPLACWLRTPGVNRPKELRRRGFRRWLIRFKGLHPIRDRDEITARLSELYCAYGSP